MSLVSRFVFALLVLSSFIALQIQADYSLRRFATINNVGRPAFLTLVKGASPSTTKTLFVTTFYPFEKDAMYMVPHIEKLQEGQTGPASILVNATTSDGFPFLWPNEVNFIPPFGEFPYGAITVGTGFLVPGKGKGSIFFFPFTNSEHTQLGAAQHIVNPSSSEWFYHRAIPVQGFVRDSKYLDLVTCRAHKPIVGSWKSELVLLSALDAKATKWNTTVLASGGCDIFFNVADLNGDGNDELIATSFVNQELVLYWSKTGKYWTPETIQSRVIDNKAGAFFSGLPFSFDGTGKLQYLATNHQYDKQDPVPTMYLYQLPSDVLTGTWNRSVVASGYPVVKTLIKGQAPGGAKAFYPQPQLQNGRPWIALAGDGSQAFYVYEPVGPVGTLEYKLFYTENLAATIGDILVDDINNDGYNEIFVPVFEKSYINVYTFAPKQ